MLDITCLTGTTMLVHLIAIILVTVAPMDVTGDRPQAGRFLGPSKAVIRGATGSQNHGSSLSPEEHGRSRYIE
ncbi:glycine-rich protein [Zea mays]|uniref:Glycine-rich protein n=1 Tax=Zea mays TaxID=4577 RepID=A0A1D6NVY5_MAIZE|nr:glycine-rich protein [Zea mays]